MSLMHRYIHANKPLNIIAGTGVKNFGDIIAIIVGSWPSRAPTKNKREEVKIDPLTDPKQERETNSGMMNDAIPRTLSPQTTATALDARNSLGDRTVKYAMFAVM